MKDNFSTQAADYSIYCPSYPQKLYNYLYTLLSDNEIAWDCATGNGQVARVLAQHLKNIYAIDIVENQLKNALKLPNITYQLGSAEKTAFENHAFDLITVAQAVHWFNFDDFYTEVKRTLKPNGIIAVINYALI